MIMVAFTCSAQVLKTSIIPLPKKIEYMSGEFKIPKSNLYVIENGTKAAIYLAQRLQSEFQFRTNVSPRENQPCIEFKQIHSTKNKEAYTLVVQPHKIIISSSTEAGLFYGSQSLIQLFEAARTEKQGITSQIINDEPRFSWRAFMLDEARYFKGEKEVLQLLDIMAELKMNIFHWHLTDDQGWRYESKIYPLLTTIGSIRTQTQIGGWNSTEFDSIPHEGFYTQKQIEHIVKYANDRHIKIVPEIEMPGHASAAIAAYPWLGSKDEVITVPTTFGKHYSIFNVTNSKVLEFLENLIKEALPLFNTDIIHIGGDEVRFNQWEENPEIRKYKDEKGFTSYMDIQIEAINKISRFISTQKASMMGWNEILGRNLHADDHISFSTPSQRVAPNTIVEFWKGDLNEMKKAAKEGYRLVNSYNFYTYLDYDDKTIPLSKAYAFEPVPKGLPAKFIPNIIGLGCQMWGEWIPTPNDMYKRIFPRIGAYAEVGWSIKKDYPDFVRRLKYRVNSWRNKGVPIVVPDTISLQ